jgi:hypothetical protein
MPEMNVARVERQRAPDLPVRRSSTVSGSTNPDQSPSDACKDSAEGPTWSFQGNLPTEEVTQWYRPSWQDGLRYIGYRWIYLTPAVGLVILGVAVMFRPDMAGLVIRVGYKLITVVVGIAAWLVGHVIRQATQGRKEPFCIFCGYNLTGLPDNYRCPECGRPYTWAMIDEYRRDPQWFIERWKARRELPAAAKPFEAGPVRRRKRAKDGTE